MECGLVRERGIVAEKIGAPKFKILSEFYLNIMFLLHRRQTSPVQCLVS